MKNCMNQWAIKAMCALHSAKQEERGDTNIISIVVILAIVLALAVVFKGNLTSLFNNIWSKVTSSATNF